MFCLLPDAARTERDFAKKMQKHVANGANLSKVYDAVRYIIQNAPPEEGSGVKAPIVCRGSAGSSSLSDDSHGPPAQRNDRGGFQDLQVTIHPMMEGLRVRTFGRWV